MSADKNGKAGPVASGAKPAAKTVVGVPALPAVPADRPSDLEMTRQLPPRDTHAEEDLTTALDVKAASAAEAERVLAWTGFTQEEISTAHAPRPAHAAPAPSPSPKPPGVVGALPKPAPRPLSPSKTLPPSAEMFHGLQRPATLRTPMDLEKGTRPGVAAPAGTTPKGRATLLLDSSVPPVNEQRDSDASQERAPIVVPGTGAMAPKAVTQPPPWGDGVVRMGPAIPKGPPPPRGPEPSMEEISGSLLLADTSNEQPAAGVEEISSSMLVEDAPDGRPAAVVKPSGALSAAPRAGMSSTPPPLRKSIKPPVPSVRPPPRSPSARPPENAQQAPVGLPELPTATPGPPIELPSAAPISAPPVETPLVLDAAAPPREAPSPGGHVPTAPMTGDIELTRLPRGGLAPLIDALRTVAERARKAVIESNTLGADGRPKWFLPVVAVGGLMVGVGLFAVLGSVLRSRGDPAHGAAATSASSVSASTGTASLPTALPTALAPASPQGTTPRPVATLPACTVSGTPHVLSPNATVTAGVEVVRLGDELAVGFAPSDHEAIALRLDPATLSATTTARAHARDVLRRVTPVPGARGGLAVALDVDRKNDRLQGRRTVLADPTIQFGAADGHVAWSRPGGAPVGEIWPVDEGGNVESLRGAAENTTDRTVAAAFRRGGAVWMGVTTGTTTLTPKGALARVDGLGTAVGSPAIALSGGTVMVAWSDRPSSDDPWRIRWTRFDTGSAPATPQTFTPPAGGKGAQAMSPSLSPLPGGRFLLVWTEGPATEHDVRALTLDHDGTPSGAPMVISSSGVNAGQGQAAVTPLGQGVVAYLESGGTGFQVVATPISCGE